MYFRRMARRSEHSLSLEPSKVAKNSAARSRRKKQQRSLRRPLLIDIASWEHLMQQALGPKNES